MALFDDVRKKAAAPEPQMPQTFAQMQRGGYARPPQSPAYAALTGAAGSTYPHAMPSAPNDAVAARPFTLPYQPSNVLNQSNLEGYLYDTLANPTNSLSYKNTMHKIGADIDTDASRRGVYYSTIPVGAYSQAGADLAAQTQQGAYENIRGYNNDYTAQLLKLLGMG